MDIYTIYTNYTFEYTVRVDNGPMVLEQTFEQINKYKILHSKKAHDRLKLE